MGYPRVTAEEWAKRALTVNAIWLDLPETSNHRGRLFSEFCKFVDMLIEGEVAHA